MINRNMFILIIMVIVAIGFNRYQHSDLRIERLLTSNKWHMNLNYYVSPENVIDEDIRLGSISHVLINCDIKYLTNRTYVRNSYIEMTNAIDNSVIKMNMGERGNWKANDGYVFTEPKDMVNISPNEHYDISKQQVQLIEKLLLIDAKQTRRVDRVNKNTILLTALDNSSRVLFAN